MIAVQLVSMALVWAVLTSVALVVVESLAHRVSDAVYAARATTAFVLIIASVTLPMLLGNWYWS